MSTFIPIIKKLLILLLLSAALLLLAANLAVNRTSISTTSVIADLPERHACLILGTSQYRADASPSLFFASRINAAAEVYRSGKCSLLVVSGRVKGETYNEPEAMKQSLVAKGVPESAIVCDYAGVRTLDSVIRFKRVFGQDSGIVISQQFHSERAIYIASHNGIALTGYNAQDVDFRRGFKARWREVFAKLLAVLDVYLLHTQPADSGERK